MQQSLRLIDWLAQLSVLKGVRNTIKTTPKPAAGNAGAMQVWLAGI
jgi:hypothetical protein